MIRDNKPLWVPDEELVSRSNMTAFVDWLATARNLRFLDYDELWRWSVSDVSGFWESIVDFFDIDFHSPYNVVLKKPEVGMIGSKWFEGATVNYAEHIFKNRTSEYPALLFSSEMHGSSSISWERLEREVASVASWLRTKGVRKGDRVVSLMPNIPETVISFLAVNSLGAIWSSCSPDFGNESILERFEQIEPKVLFISDGYAYNGKRYPKLGSWEKLREALPSIQQVVCLPLLDGSMTVEGTTSWSDLIVYGTAELEFVPVPFDHPIWVLYSSGTTGKPKAITHSVGGCLLEHMKAISLHQDVKRGERYFWFSTTGWMMWNFSMASLLAGATLVLYDGSPGHPEMDALWQLAKSAEIDHFGAGAAYYISCMKAGIHFDPSEFPKLRSIGSTGSPLPPEAFEWVYRSVKKDVWLISLSGGTDICSAFVGGCPLLPVFPGEIQCRMLGCDLESYDENGGIVRESLGEMVIRTPMPSMPITFWNDPGQNRYRSSYFEHYPGIWRHGDWIEITKRGTVVIYGRSDATLNRDGVRIGTSEIYSAVEGISEVEDSLVVCVERPDGTSSMPLFVVMKAGRMLDDEMKQRIRSILRIKYSPRHVPDEIYSVADIPYTISGKKMETPVKKILMGMDPELAASRDTMRNPGSLDQFIRLATHN
jgi:acetoacetyl-CoA synthetase